jgi:hypothetical protein
VGVIDGSRKGGRQDDMMMEKSTQACPVQIGDEEEREQPGKHRILRT